MKYSKGFTLVEVIISLAILAIVTVSFLSVLTNNFLITKKTKDLSISAFEVQESVEEKIDNLKKYLLKEEIPPSGDYKTGNIKIWDSLKSGGATINYYEISESNNNKIYATLVSNFKPKLFETISIEKINLQFNKSSKTKLLYGYGDQSILALGSFKNDENYRYSHLTNVIEWYVSDNKFIMPIPNNAKVKSDIIEDVHEIVNYYPMFPRDFIVVENDRIDAFGESTSEIVDITPYIGKHLVYTVTAGSKSGKLGTQKVSDSIFISGLPITQNLAMHFDANFLDSYNSNGLSEVIVDNGKNLVDRWYNLFSIISEPDNKPTEYAYSPNNNSNRPELLKTQTYDDYRGQFIRFEVGKSLSITKSVTNGTVFVVARNNNDSNSIIIKNNNINNDIDFGTDNEKNKWKLVVKDMPSNNLVFGNANLDIAEIIIYKSVLSEINKKKVADYLIAKYGL